MADLKELQSLLNFSDDKVEAIYQKNISSTREIDRRTKEYLNRYDDLERTFEKKSSLTDLDMSILIFTAAVQCLRWYVLSNENKFKLANASDADRYLDQTRRSIQKNFPSVSDIAESVLQHTVPYDATTRSQNFKINYLGESVVSGSSHRFTTLGHDPVAGIIFGTMNIATNTLTVADISQGFPSYVVINQQSDDKTNLVTTIQDSFDIMKNNPQVIGAAFIRQVIHMGTDFFT